MGSSSPEHLRLPIFLRNDFRETKASYLFHAERPKRSAARTSQQFCNTFNFLRLFFNAVFNCRTPQFCARSISELLCSQELPRCDERKIEGILRFATTAATQSLRAWLPGSIRVHTSSASFAIGILAIGVKLQNSVAFEVVKDQPSPRVTRMTT